MVINEVLFGDNAVNWFVIATTISIAAFCISLKQEGSFFRNALVNVVVGMPAAIWALDMQSGVSVGGVMPLGIAIALCFGHAGIGVMNFLAATPNSKKVSKGISGVGRR